MEGYGFGGKLHAGKREFLSYVKERAGRPGRYSPMYSTFQVTNVGEDVGALSAGLYSVRKM
jgi:hypothetical protein